jgi:hypothetical protein
VVQIYYAAALGSAVAMSSCTTLLLQLGDVAT